MFGVVVDYIAGVGSVDYCSGLDENLENSDETALVIAMFGFSIHDAAMNGKFDVSLAGEVVDDIVVGDIAARDDVGGGDDVVVDAAVQAVDDGVGIAVQQDAVDHAVAVVFENGGQSDAVDRRIVEQPNALDFGKTGQGDAVDLKIVGQVGAVDFGVAEQRDAVDSRIDAQPDVDS